MALNVGYLPGDIYINTIVSAALEVPAIIICIILLDWKYLGRKGTAVVSFGVATLALFICVPLDLYGKYIIPKNIVLKFLKNIVLHS